MRLQSFGQSGCAGLRALGAMYREAKGPRPRHFSKQMLTTRRPRFDHISTTDNFATAFRPHFQEFSTTFQLDFDNVLIPNTEFSGGGGAEHYVWIWPHLQRNKAIMPRTTRKHTVTRTHRDKHPTPSPQTPKLSGQALRSWDKSELHGNPARTKRSSTYGLSACLRKCGTPGLDRL